MLVLLKATSPACASDPAGAQQLRPHKESLLLLRKTSPARPMRRPTLPVWWVKAGQREKERGRERERGEIVDTEGRSTP
jgi:hypothetical protein